MWPNVDSVTNQSLFDHNYSHTLFSVLSPLYYLTWVLINSSISGIANGSQRQEYPFSLYVRRWLNNPWRVFLCWCLKSTTKLFCLCMIYYLLCWTLVPCVDLCCPCFRGGLTRTGWPRCAPSTMTTRQLTAESRYLLQEVDGVGAWHFPPQHSLNCLLQHVYDGGHF